MLYNISINLSYVDMLGKNTNQANKKQFFSRLSKLVLYNLFDLTKLNSLGQSQSHWREEILVQKSSYRPEQG